MSQGGPNARRHAALAAANEWAFSGDDAWVDAAAPPPGRGPMVGDRALPDEAVGAGRRSSPPAPAPRTTYASGERRRPPTDPVIVRRRVRVWGSVQGVFFRATCAREASRRGLAGWVR